MIPISSSALHVYYSALVTMPECSLRSQAPPLDIARLVSPRGRQWKSGVLVLEGHRDRVLSVAISSNGLHIVSGSWDHTVRVWDRISGTHQRTMTGHTGLVNSVGISPDSRLIVSGSSDGTVRVWKTVSGTCHHILNRSWDDDETHPVSLASSGNGKESPHDVIFVAFTSPEQIVSGFSNGTLVFWDVLSGNHQRIMNTGDGKVTVLAFAYYKCQIAVASDDSIMRVYGVESGSLQQTCIGHMERVRCLAFSNDRLRIASGSEDGVVLVWDTQSGNCQHSFVRPLNSVMSVAFSFNGLALVSGHQDGSVQVWDLASGSPQLILTGHTARVTSVLYPTVLKS
jgi:WD40 repeat protein